MCCWSENRGRIITSMLLSCSAAKRGRKRQCSGLQIRKYKAYGPVCLVQLTESLLSKEVMFISNYSRSSWVAFNDKTNLFLSWCQSLQSSASISLQHWNLKIWSEKEDEQWDIFRYRVLGYNVRCNQKHVFCCHLHKLLKHVGQCSLFPTLIHPW